MCYDVLWRWRLWWAWWFFVVFVCVLCNLRFFHFFQLSFVASLFLVFLPLLFKFFSIIALSIFPLKFHLLLILFLYLLYVLVTVFHAIPCVVGSYFRYRLHDVSNIYPILITQPHIHLSQIMIWQYLLIFFASGPLAFLITAKSSSLKFHEWTYFSRYSVHVNVYIVIEIYRNMHVYHFCT